ncbi:MAG: hypothetical protein IJH71_01420 [Eubacterium sp.]|nr:hypothetical protein [Eubacterium sp.]
MKWHKKFIGFVVEKSKDGARWKKIILTMAAVVVFITTYTLILPAISIDKDSADKESGFYIQNEGADTESDTAPFLSALAPDQSYEVVIKCDDNTVLPSSGNLQVKSISADEPLYRSCRKELASGIKTPGPKRLQDCRSIP